MRELIRGRLEADPFRSFFLSTSTATYRIDRSDQVVLRETSISVKIFGHQDHILIDSVRSIKVA